MKLNFCVACGKKQDLQHHHLKPRVAGGTDDETNLITLCQECHAIYHNLNFRDHSYLTKLGLQKAKARGVKLGNPNNQKVGEDARVRAKKFQPVLDEYISRGNRSLNSISRALNEDGIGTPVNNKKWYAKSIKDQFSYLGYTLEEYLEKYHCSK